MCIANQSSFSSGDCWIYLIKCNNCWHFFVLVNKVWQGWICIFPQMSQRWRVWAWLLTYRQESCSLSPLCCCCGQVSLDVCVCVYMHVWVYIRMYLECTVTASTCKRRQYLFFFGVFDVVFTFSSSSSTQAVIALFCRQYDIIKDNDSNSTKDKAKRPLVRATSSYYNASAGSSPIYHNGAVRSSRVTNFFPNPSLRKLSNLFLFLTALILSQHRLYNAWSFLAAILFLLKSLCSCIRDLLATRAAAIMAKYKTTSLETQREKERERESWLWMYSATCSVKVSSLTR